MKLSHSILNSVHIYDIPEPLVIGTAGKAFNGIDYSNDNDGHKSKEIEMLANHIKMEKRNIIMVKQVHGDTIFEADNLKNTQLPEADGMITKSAGICLVIRTADCVPVFVFDSNSKILGAVHSGWKGCRFDITGKLIRKLKSDYRSRESDLYAYVLPSIGPESYNVNMDVGQYFPDDVKIKDNIVYLDLRKNIYNSLIRENIPEKNIFVSEFCTYKNNTDFFSHRRGDNGRNLNFTYIKYEQNKNI
jgi:polyphenol oxidase